MCGICGIFNVDESRQVSSDILIKMRDALVHRGPDDAGEFVQGNVGLAMRRLEIIDLQTGRQPIHNENNRIWIVFNGEIYNFLELREGLIKKGHRFYTKSDTEVIVHLYEEEGIRCVDKLNGMFAFCIWDSAEKRLFLARDRMGQKPLYYRFKNGQLLFASEIKSLLKHPSVSRELDQNSLNEYLTFEYVPAPKSIFKDISKLPASHLMVVQGGKVSLERYWNIRLGWRDNIDEVEASERLFDLLDKAVNRHLISDVPLGIFLSGGIDSSAIAAFAARPLGNRMKTFSVSFDDKTFDESPYAELAADHIKSEHYQMKFSAKDCLEIIPDIYDIIDEPFADASLLPTYILSRFTRQHVTVALGGDGGDELFAGYPTHIAHHFADKIYLKLPYFIRKRILEAVGGRLPVSFNNFSLDFKVKKFISGVGFPADVRHQIWMGAFSPAQKLVLFLPSVRNGLAGRDGLEPLSENFEELAGSDERHADNHLKILFSDMRLYLQDDILTKVDRASMANSLEVRSPFLDNDLVEFVNSLKFTLKFRYPHTKLNFRKLLLARKILPPKIINRGKKGFGIPVARWIHNELRQIICDFLSEDRIKNAGLFNYSYIKQMLKEHFERRKDNRKLIWALFMFELWKERFLD
ncbi:MAG: asparagine synthase (glutamine-hydrolyzing) [Candidatus Omnitrophica bacterium]|nr:asparagine synthase (glutamine-hydrolyzing) [Candidatus Omnitrophota bacterium]